MNTQLSDESEPKVLRQVAGHLWALLDEADDPDSELTVEPAMRRRIEGAALGLEAVTRLDQAA